MPDNALPREGSQIFDALAKASSQYDEYLRISAISNSLPIDQEASVNTRRRDWTVPMGLVLTSTAR